jgi:hypothetical protein
MQKLNEIPEKNPFKVPENYFEEANRRIISATSGYKNEVRETGLYSRFRPYFLIAASVTGFILISYSALKLVTHDKISTQVSEAMNEENPDSFINDIDILTIEEDASSIILSEEERDVNKADIIEYLLSENIEINDIYEQL